MLQQCHRGMVQIVCEALAAAVDWHPKLAMVDCVFSLNPPSN
jgi:hypothetical protein